MARLRHPFKDDAERRFPHRVDVPVPGDGCDTRCAVTIHVLAGSWMPVAVC